MEFLLDNQWVADIPNCHAAKGLEVVSMAGMRKGSGKPTATNKVHFACFACRKTFKQQGSSNWDRNVPERPFLCPNCKEPMARMGRYFKAPAQRALRAWREVERRYQSGERFD